MGTVWLRTILIEDRLIENISNESCFIEDYLKENCLRTLCDEACMIEDF